MTVADGPITQPPAVAPAGIATAAGGAAVAATQTTHPQEDADNTEVVPGRATRTAHKTRSTRRRRAANTTRAAPAPAAAPTLTVPRPGSTVRGDRKDWFTVRRWLVGAAAAGLAAAGFAVGASAAGARPDPVTPGVTADDIAAYRLTRYPVDGAADLAVRYVRTCLTFDQDRAAQTARAARLAAMSATTVDSQCGWSATGQLSVVYAAFNGQLTPADNIPDGRGAYLGVTVTTSDGTTRDVVVPVYAADPASGSGLLVVGPVAVMPGDTPAGPVHVVEPADRDPHLSDAVGAVLPGFFAAWAVSDGTALARYVTPDADATATAGLHASLTDPKVGAIDAVPDAAVDDGDLYPAGATLTASTTVIWTVPNSQATPTADLEGIDGRAATLQATYRVQMVNTATGWFVTAVQPGSAVDGAYPRPATPTSPSPSERAEPLPPPAAATAPATIPPTTAGAPTTSAASLPAPFRSSDSATEPTRPATPAPAGAQRAATT